MIIGSMKEVFLTRAKEIFLFDCRVAGFDPQAVGVYRNVLGSFIHFTGDIKVKQLTPDHVALYISNLSDGPNEGDEHAHMVMSYFAMIQTWIHWINCQKMIAERSSSFVKPPRLASLFPLRPTRSLTRCE